jgi:hypothetical protein
MDYVPYKALFTTGLCSDPDLIYQFGRWTDGHQVCSSFSGTSERVTGLTFPVLQSTFAAVLNDAPADSSFRHSTSGLLSRGGPRCSAIPRLQSELGLSADRSGCRTMTLAEDLLPGYGCPQRLLRLCDRLLGQVLPVPVSVSTRHLRNSFRSRPFSSYIFGML